MEFSVYYKKYLATAEAYIETLEPQKQKYATAYLQYLYGARKEYPEPENYHISYLAAARIKRQLNKIV